MPEMKKILYVEDDAINALIIEKLLNKIYEIKIARSKKACLEILDKQDFDLILTDINLGESNEDGILLMKKIKEIPQYKAVKIVAVTAFALPEEQAKFLEEGFDAYISKPLEENELKNTIKTLLESK